LIYCRFSFFWRISALNIAIIDDVQQDLDALAEAAREHYDQRQISIQLHTFSSPEDFWNSYSPGSYDLIFLDIYIKQANGMDLAAQLREKGDSCALIFVTSSDAFAVASYDVQAAYYLLKPLDTNKLTKVLDSIQIKRAQDTRYIDNIINLRLDITHLYYPAKNSFQKGRLKRREIFTELLLYTLTT